MSQNGLVLSHSAKITSASNKTGRVKAGKTRRESFSTSLVGSHHSSSFLFSISCSSYSSSSSSSSFSPHLFPSLVRIIFYSLPTICTCSFLPYFFLLSSFSLAIWLFFSPYFTSLSFLPPPCPVHRDFLHLLHSFPVVSPPPTFSFSSLSFNFTSLSFLPSPPLCHFCFLSSNLPKFRCTLALTWKRTLT